MSQLKILFVIDGLWVGGTEHSLAEMLPCLVQADIIPIIACFNRHQEEGVESDVLNQGFDVRFLDDKGLASQVPALRKLIKTEQPDIIHTALFKANMIGRLAATRLPVPVLCSLVNTPYEPIRYQDPKISAIRLRTLQMIDSWTARFLTTHFHAVSKAAKASAVNTLHLSPEKITVIERGRDSTRLGRPGVERRLRARQQLGLSATDEVIVNVGKHEYQKGQRYLLQTMARIARTRPDLVLLIAGRSGHFSQQLKHLRDQLDLNGRVKFLGHREDVPEVLASADLFVFPSLYEGLPGAVIEAMALGLPIIAADIDPVREIVEDGRNALLVKPGCSTELTQAVEMLLDNHDKAAAFGKCSREIFEGRFTLNRIAAKTIALYQSVLTMHNTQRWASSAQHKYAQRPKSCH